MVMVVMLVMVVMGTIWGDNYDDMEG